MTAVLEEGGGGGGGGLDAGGSLHRQSAGAAAVAAAAAATAAWAASSAPPLPPPPSPLQPPSDLPSSSSAATRRARLRRHSARPAIGGPAVLHRPLRANPLPDEEPSLLHWPAAPPPPAVAEAAAAAAAAGSGDAPGVRGGHPLTPEERALRAMVARELAEELGRSWSFTLGEGDHGRGGCDGGEDGGEGSQGGPWDRPPLPYPCLYRPAPPS